MLPMLFIIGLLCQCICVTMTQRLLLCHAFSQTLEPLNLWSILTVVLLVWISVLLMLWVIGLLNWFCFSLTSEPLNLRSTLTLVLLYIWIIGNVCDGHYLMSQKPNNLCSILISMLMSVWIVGLEMLKCSLTSGSGSCRLGDPCLPDTFVGSSRDTKMLRRLFIIVVLFVWIPGLQIHRCSLTSGSIGYMRHNIGGGVLEVGANRTFLPGVSIDEGSGSYRLSDPCLPDTVVWSSRDTKSSSGYMRHNIWGGVLEVGANRTFLPGVSIDEGSGSYRLGDPCLLYTVVWSSRDTKMLRRLFIIGSIGYMRHNIWGGVLEVGANRTFLPGVSIDEGSGSYRLGDPCLPDAFVWSSRDTKMLRRLFNIGSIGYMRHNIGGGVLEVGAKRTFLPGVSIDEVFTLVWIVGLEILMCSLTFEPLNLASTLISVPLSHRPGLTSGDPTCRKRRNSYGLLPPQMLPEYSDFKLKSAALKKTLPGLHAIMPNFVNEKINAVIFW